MRSVRRHLLWLREKNRIMHVYAILGGESLLRIVLKCVVQLLDDESWKVESLSLVNSLLIVFIDLHENTLC